DRTTYSNKYYWDNGDKTIQLNPQQMYRIYVQSNKTAYLVGESVFGAIIYVHHGWNRIGYLCATNLPIATALSDYTDDASEGDIIKSQNEFAVLNIDAQGNRVWKGTLKFMQTGEGYMLRRQAENEVDFYYPQYLDNSRYSMMPKKESLFHNITGESMNIIARVEGFDLQEGDRLVAYSGGENRGMVEADESDIFFLSVSKGEEKGIGFAIERDGEIVATAPMQLPYISNDVKGTVDEPTAIRFVSIDNLDGEGWYTLSGIKLNGKPAQKGVYIHNGRKKIVK
ncbi:MAG: hypothetical protein IK084_04010, partial [Bacteroidaceae bacterium]|nr:hypothetical protein [Bacteroidaceae bacterium]